MLALVFTGGRPFLNSPNIVSVKAVKEWIEKW